MHCYAPNFEEVKIAMPPTSKKLKGQIGLGLFICLSMYPLPPPPPPPLLRKQEKKRKFFF